MKRAITLLVTALLMVAGVQTAMAQKMVVKTTDNGLVRFDVSKVEYVTFIKDDFVDLDLPSGTLWASCNIGASSPEQYGFYFAWGETEEKNDYSWLTYRYCKGTYDSLTKYCTAEYYGTFDGLDALEDADDAAAMTWGSPWKVPSMEQFDELMNPENTTVKKTFQDDVYGMLITSKRNGESIFLPAAGIRMDTDLINDGSRAYYWSRDVVRVDNFLARDFSFTTTSNTPNDTKNRCYGLSIRPVRYEDKFINGHEYVKIGGLKWATMNVGATTVAGSYETCYGDYFAWGETQPRYASITRTAADDASFTWRNGYSSGYSKDNYPTYTGTTLDASHDAATANWGGSWRTPTSAEFQALLKACSGSGYNSQKPVNLINTITEGGIYWLSSTQTIEPVYTGVAGLLFVSKADISKRVFFPASGYVLDTSLRHGDTWGTWGRYWSSALDTSNTNFAYNSNFNSYINYYESKVESYVDWRATEPRCYGLTVRPVSD